MLRSATTSERPVLGGLIAFGILAIVLGFLNVRRSIAGVQTPVPSAAGDAPTIAVSREEEERVRRAALGAQDTDRDGLADLEEFERTKTSPFLADSDSDGRTDREEVEAGEDPSCPRGTTCGGEPIAPRGAETPTLLPTVNAPATPQPNAASAAVSAPTPDALRRALERQGFNAELLRTLSDAELLAAYQSSLAGLTQLPNGNALPIASAITAAFDAQLQSEDGSTDRSTILRSLPTDAAGIRAFLARGGFPPTELNALDDATLLTLWQQSLAEFERKGTE